ncbi:hypothetical protein CRENBAI_025347 [Crenichthys baileyi]|uniref:Uncharacterized protein n=1 Tax=Crenichthys baileyi TaxID=28760 RepID=A0AAV9RVX1_9TELE
MLHRDYLRVAVLVVATCQGVGNQEQMLHGKSGRRGGRVGHSCEMTSRHSHTPAEERWENRPGGREGLMQGGEDDFERRRMKKRETAGKGKRGVWGGEVGAGGEELREVAGEGEGSMLREPSQKQVTLRTRVAWQAGCGGDRGKETTVRELEEEEK